MLNVLPDMLIGKPANIGNSIPFETLKQAIINCGKEAGLPLTVEIDEVKIGKSGLGSMLSSSQPCVVIYNTNHKKDYNYYVLTQTKQGNCTFLSEYLGGKSKNFINLQLAQKKPSIFISNIKKKYQEEEMYYSLLDSIITTALNNILS